MNFWKNKNVLVTGINGFIGSSLARKLMGLDANVVGLVKQVNHAPPVLDVCTLVQGDICDYDTVRELISFYEIDVIFHFAAYAIVRVSARDPLSAYRVNVMGTANLLEAARSVGKCSSIVVASSDKAYGDHEDLPYKEDFSLVPKNTYDTSKACMDLISRTYANNYGMPICVTRCSNVYGPGDMNLSRIIPNTIKRILNDQPPLVYSDVENMEREFIYIDDVVNAYLLLGEAGDSVSGEAFNIGGTGPVKIHKLVAHVAYEMGFNNKLKVVKRDNIFKEIQKQYIDASKIKDAVGWEPVTNLDDGVKATVEWYKLFYEEGIYS